MNKKMNKKITNILLAVIVALSAAMPSFAQDARQRKVETIVQDVLAQMPVQDKADLDREMEDLAKSAPQSVQMLAQMMQPAEKASNNLLEYAISGVVAYASAHPQYKQAVSDALQMAAPRAADATARQFLQSQLRLLGEVTPPEFTAHQGAATYTAQYDKLTALGDKATGEIAKALKSKDRAYRMQALKFATDHGMASDEALLSKVAKAFKSAKEDGKVDIINWLGDNKAASQASLIVKAVKQGGAVADAALEALGRIGGDEACDALLSALATENGDAAMEALRCIPDNLNGKVPAAIISSQGEKTIALLKLANARRLRNTGALVMELCNSLDAEVAKAAREALSGVVGKDNAASLAKCLDKAPQEQVANYAKALKASVGFMQPQEQLQLVGQLMQGASNTSRFYPIIASTDTKEAVQQLQEAWEKNGSKEALEALKTCNNFEASKAMLTAAKQGDDKAMLRYVQLVSDNVSDLDDRCKRLSDALGITKSASTRKAILKALGSTPTMTAFTNVGKYLGDDELAYTAAYAAKDIAAKCEEELDYKQLCETLTLAAEKIKVAGSADDGYAIDEIKKMIAEAEPSPVYQLSEEEEKEGYEMLFDGTNLDKWTGNKVGYVPVNGCIVVTANYGNESNLYTVNEYQDFILRFEFCFTRPGVNNGVGIRTPMGVDAAYYGMCESQVLDHDDPIYEGLHDYQVHGSVYGVIPAKRIKHKPLGEWSTEEIRVQGNHITVTVNGEVIVDGDISKACKGHNVAPDGSDYNPYTVDHRNHPGMFNKKGHIGFLGHGAGLKYRNVRVLDLNAKGKKK